MKQKIFALLRFFSLILCFFLAVFLIYQGYQGNEFESSSFDKTTGNDVNGGKLLPADTSNISDTSKIAISDTKPVITTDTKTIVEKTVKNNSDELEKLKILSMQNQFANRLNSSNTNNKQNIPDTVIKTNAPSTPTETKSDTENMIFIPAGEFEFGQPGSKIKVFVDAFYIDKYEVSNEEVKKIFQNFNYKSGNEKRPAAQISLQQSLNYAKAINKDLPTVYEWEKAAGWNEHKNAKQSFPWGETFNSEYTNSSENFRFQFLDVNSGKHKDISPYGVLFMAGNIAEWTKTKLSDIKETGDEKNYSNFQNKNFYICKGGSIFDSEQNCRIYFNFLTSGQEPQTGIGFRCVKRVKR